MNRTTLIMASTLFIASSGALLAATTGQAALDRQHASLEATDIAHGVIEKVAPEAMEFTLRVDEEPEAMSAKSMVLKVNDKTVYTLDGRASTMKDALKVDRQATVSHEDKVAIRVDVRSDKSPN